MPSPDGDDALLQQAAERSRALIAALDGDAQSLREHQLQDASLAEGVTLCERASEDAAQLLKLLEEAVQRRARNSLSAASKPKQEPS